jgi:hypothetical protein
VPHPLNALLSVALEDLGRQFEFAAEGHSEALSLEIHGNLLCHLPDDGADLRDIPRLARVSKRAAHWNIAVAERRGWIVLGGESGKRAQLTTAGRSAREACEQCLVIAEASWRERFGHEVVARLRSSLQALVGQFDLDLPHHPTGYGPADPSVTGGVSARWGRRHALRVKGLPGLVFDPVAEHHAAEAWEEESGGRLYVRDSGQDWRPVPRCGDDTVSELSLFALLSQALMAFAIDYEGCGGLALARSGNILRHIGDEGVEIALRPSRSRGSTRLVPAEPSLAALERHAYAAVVADPRDKRKGRLTLTEKGERVRDAYDDIVVAIERRWKRRYGAAVVRELRSTLSSVQKLADLPGLMTSTRSNERRLAEW